MAGTGLIASAAPDAVARAFRLWGWLADASTTTPLAYEGLFKQLTSFWRKNA
jgi:hypothetical protein